MRKAIPEGHTKPPGIRHIDNGGGGEVNRDLGVIKMFMPHTADLLEEGRGAK